MKYFLQKKNVGKKSQSGFTLIETLVAISILMVAITGPLVVASQVLNYSYFARDQITAFYLAQDAIEYIHNVRDSNALVNLQNAEQVSWLTNLNSCLVQNGMCRFDSNLSPDALGNIVGCPAEGCAPLNYDSSTGLYAYGGGDVSKFTREINIIETDADREASITVTIKWNTGSLTGKSISVNEHIFNWH